MRIALVGVNGALNSGDHSLCAATIRLIREAFPAASLCGVHRSPGLQSRCFPSVQWLLQIGASYSQNRLARRITNLVGMGSAAAILAMRSRSGAFLSYPASQTYRALASADLVVGCAGGWLEDHYISIWTNLLQLSIAARNDVPIFIAPQSIGPFRHRLTKLSAGRLLRNAVGVTARESVSVNHARLLGVPYERLRVFPDLALFETDADGEQADALLHRLCGNDIPVLTGTTLMAWSFPGSSDPRTELSRYLEKVAAVARLLYARSGLKTLFLRQIRDDRGHAGDGALLRRVAAMAGEAAILCPDYLEPPVLRGVIGRCHVFWGTRLHSNIFAATQRIPAVCIAYQHKSEGIMRMLGLDEYLVWIDSFQPDQLADLIEDAQSKRLSLGRKLDETLRALRGEWEQLKEFLQDSLDRATSERALARMPRNI